MKFADPKNDIAFESAKIFNWNKEELEVYDYVSMNEGKKKSEIETARLDGKLERSIEIAKKSLEQGLDLDTVKIITGLTDKELELLVN